jgi:hypothetical protein
LVGKPEGKKQLGRSVHNTLKMVVVDSTEMVVITNKPTQCNPEDHNSRYLICTLVINIAFYSFSDAGSRTNKNPHA